MAAPTIRAVGTGVSGTTGTVTASAPAGIAVGDLEILVASTQSGGTITITTNGGGAWTAMGGSPVDPGVATTSDKLYIWWRIRQTGDTNPGLNASADHIMTTRVAITGGSFDPTTPIEIAVSGTEATSDTSFSFAPGNSTAGPDRLLFVVVSSGVDSNTGQAGTTLTNANTTSNTIQAENQTLSGGGGGFWIGTGILAAAGAVGTWTNTMTAASPKGYIGFAVRPYVSDVSAPTSGALDTFNAGANQALTARTGWRSSIISSGTVTANTDAVPTYAAGSTTTQAENAWDASSSDQEVWVKFGSVIGLMWLYTRIDTTPGAQAYYELESDVTAFKITRSVGGVTTALRTVSHGLTRAAGDQLCLRSKGAYHEVWYKTAAGSWTLLWAVYDESTAGPGYIGMDIGNASPALRIDEFGGGPFGPGTDALTFTSAGTSASTFSLNRRRPLAFTSAGASTSSFALALVVIGSPGPYYGPQILNEGLFNQRIGLNGWKIAYKERLEHGGSLISISAYVVASGAYGGGTGGTLRCRVETDNGSGRPSGTLIATGAEATLSPGTGIQVNTWTFGTPPTVTQGQLVHFVWDNTDAAPNTNYSSIDNIDVSGYEQLPQPTIPNSDRFVSVFDSGAWRDGNDEFYPIFRTLYGDGYKGGQSHYECGNPRYMGGTQMVRQKITPTASHTVRRVNVAVARYPSTTHDLTLKLRNLTAGTVLDTLTIPLRAIHQAVHATPDRLGYRHVGVELSAPVTLSSGTVYALELSSPSETIDPYMTGPTRIGGVPASFGALFDAADRVPDMLFEYTTDGSTWLTETGQSQVQLYFHTTAATTALAFTSAGTSASTFNLNRRRGLVWAESAGGDSAVLDDFNSGAGGNVSARAGWDAGALWSGETTLVVNSVPDAAVPTAASAFRSNVWGSSFTDAECWAEVGALGAGSPYTLDLGVRVTAFGAGASTYYAMEVNLVNGDFTILKYVAGSSTILATNTVSVPHAAGDAWKIRVSGSTITAWRRMNGVWIPKMLSTGASVSDSAITGAGRLAIEVSFADTTVKVNTFGGGTFTNTTGGVGTSLFNLTTQHASGPTALAFTSAGTSASTFTLNRRRPLTFTSTGTSASTFSLNRRRPLAFTSTGTSASTFALNRARPLAFTSAGTSTSAFALNRRRPLAFTSTGASASTFTLNQRRALTFTSTGTSTSSFVLVRRRALTFTSAGTSTSTFTLTSQHAPAIIALAFTSAGTSTSSFTLNRRRPLSFTSIGTSASTFALNVRRGLTFTSTGTSISTFALSQRRALAFTSTGTSTSTFSLNRRRPLSFTSAGTSISIFTLSTQHAPAITPLTFTSTGTSTSSFTLNRRRPLTFTSSGTSTSTFSLSQRRALAFTSAGTSTSIFSLSRRRTLTFTSTGTSTSTFALNRARPLAFTSAGTSTSSFALNQRRVLTFTSTGASTSTFALTQRRALTFTSTGVGTSTFSLNRRRPLSFTSTGTSTSTFTLATQHVPTQVQLTFTSAGTSASTFVLTTQHAPVKREMTFTSAGVGTSTFTFRAKRALAFTSVGTSTSTFSFAAKRALTFTSAGTSTSTFALTRRRALSMTSSGVGTSTFTLTRRRALAFLSSGLSASSFSFSVRPGLAFNSTGVGTSTFVLTALHIGTPVVTLILDDPDPTGGLYTSAEPEFFIDAPPSILSDPQPGEVG